MGDPLGNTAAAGGGGADAPYYAFVDDYPFRAAYRQQQARRTMTANPADSVYASDRASANVAQGRMHSYEEFIDDSEAPASLMLEMNPIREDSNSNSNNANNYGEQQPSSTSERRRLRFGDQPYQRVASHEENSFPGRGILNGDTGGRLGSGLRNWRSRVSSRERAIYEWTNVDNLDTFFTRVYYYYQGKGVYCILLNRFLSLLMLAFIIAFTTFLVGCVDYTKIRTSKSLSDALYDSCSSHMSGWLKFFVVAAWLYWSWKLVVFVYDVRKLVEMYNFYTFLLEIPDCDMQTVDWNLVVSRIIKLRETTPSILNAHPSLRINAHDICNRILRKENYLIALINKDLLDLTVPAPLRYMPMLGGPLLTRTVEWNLQLCLINYAFDENGQVKKAFLRDSQRHMLIEGLRRRFITMGFINFICAPFIFVYLLLMLFFRYLAEYHKYPSAISSRQYTRFARWKFREFDELPHLFQKRLDRSLEDANRYVDQFPRQNTAHLARFISFIAGSFALVLFLLTILDQELLISFYITSDRSVAFYLGLFGTIFAVARGAIPDENIVFEPEKTLRAVVAETHYLPSEWRNRLHTDEIRRQFCELFDLKVTILLQELIAVIFTPFILWFSLPGCSSQIIDFFREFTVHVDGVGYICSFALFDFKRHGNIRYGAPSEAINEHYISKEGKMEKSFINFKANNPDWEPEDMAGSLYLTRLQGNGGGGGGMTNEQSRVRRSTSGTTARGEDMSNNTRMMNQSPRNRTHPLMHQRTFSAESLNDSMLEETTLSPMNNEVTGLSSDNNNNNSNSISLYGPTTNTLGSLPPLPYTSSHQQEDDTMSQQGQQQPQHSISHSGAAYRSTIATSDDIEHHPLHMTAAFNIRPTLEENDVQQRNIDATLADLSAMKATMMRDSQWPPSEDEQYHKDNGNDNDDSDDITENGGIASTSTAMTVQNTMENIEHNISSTTAITTITQTTAYHTTATLNGNDNNNDEDANDNEADDDDVKSNEDGNVFALMNEFYDDRLPTL